MIEIKRNTGENPVKVYAKTFEYEAYDQVKRLANYEPYLNSTIRIMPDAHAGKGCTVGTTMTLHGMVTPNLVGGMLVINLGHNQFNGEPDLKKLDDVIHKFVPAGFEIHNQAWTKFNKLDDLLCRNSVDLQRAVLSIGTLGGGNHFIELDKSETGDYMLVIHTGSRYLGKQVCEFYQNLAYKKLNEMGSIKAELVKKLKAEGREKDINDELKKVQKPSASKELAHLTGNDFNNYIYDMEIVQEYAVLNQRTIANIILQKIGTQSHLLAVARFVFFGHQYQFIGIEQHDALPRPFLQIAVVRNIAAEIIVQLLINIDQGRRYLHTRLY